MIVRKETNEAKMHKKYTRSVFWFRRDLRLEDNAGLYKALKYSESVHAVFIFDRAILDELKDTSDARVSFIHQQICQLKERLQENGQDLQVYYGHPTEVWKEIKASINPQAVFTNRDYEPYAKERDGQVRAYLKAHHIDFLDYKDQVIFESAEVRKDNGDPYVVFTPYKRKWLSVIDSRGVGKASYFLKSYPSEAYLSSMAKTEALPMLSLESMGFKQSELMFPSKVVSQGIIRNYTEQRNFPAVDGTSKLGIHFRFGTISIREKARKSLSLNETYLSELIWRDFYSSIMDTYPFVVENSFRSKYDRIEWRNQEEEFQAWCAGKTGYPMVDAGMRELNATGYMHNRVRMVVASFLTKHLLIDWRKGEAYFAEKLLDFDLASNNGGWQWAAGSGTDAAPYFRIFNPTSQMDKFDKKRQYIKKWIPEFGTEAYPAPIVDHKMARERCLEVYKRALNDG